MIALYNLENQYKNLALEKVRKFYTDKGVEVVNYFPLNNEQYEKVYVSSIFRFTPKPDIMSNWITGGTGYGLTTKLPREIDNIKPKLNFGFTTRGCIRKCKFCVVPEKEGNVHIVGDIYDLWDNKSKELVLFDNNILAIPDQFFKIAEQLKKEKLKVDFNQGLDFRLLTDKICKELVSLKHLHEIRFAFDYLEYKPMVIKALDMLKANGVKDWKTRWYIYIGEHDTFDTVYQRMNLLKQYKQCCYVMRDEKVYNIGEYVGLAQWGNSMGAFKMGLKEVLEKSDKMKPYAKYFKGVI